MRRRFAFRINEYFDIPDKNISFEQVNISSLSPRKFDEYDPQMCTYLLNHLTIANSLRECTSRAPKNFKIIMNDNKTILFNKCLLSSVSGTIFKLIQKNPKADSYTLKSNDHTCFIQKLSQLLQGETVVLSKDEKKPIRAIVSELTIEGVPKWLKPKESILLEKSNTSFKSPPHSRIAMSKKSFVSFLSNKDIDTNSKFCYDIFEKSFYDYSQTCCENSHQYDRSFEFQFDEFDKDSKDVNTRAPELDFEIKTQKSTYKCTLIAALSSDIIYSKFQNDPSIKSFFYDFDDENESFQVMSDFLNGSLYELGPENIELSLKFAKDLEIKPLLNELDKSVLAYKSRITNLKSNYHIMNDLFLLQSTLLSVTDENINSSYDIIVNSKWCSDKEMVKELASNIILVSSILFKNLRPLSKLFKMLISPQSISKKPSLSNLVKLILKHFSFMDIYNDNYDYYQKRVDGHYDFNSIQFLLMLKEEGILKSKDIIALWPTIRDNFSVKAITNHSYCVITPYKPLKTALPIVHNYFTPEIQEVCNEFEFDTDVMPARIRTIYEEKETLTNSIFSDDLDLFVKLTSKQDSNSELDFNFDGFIYVPFEFMIAEIPMVDFAALCGSSKVFHYLSVDKNVLVQFPTLYMAIKGRNEEILKFFTENFVNEERKSLLEKLNEDYKKWIYQNEFYFDKNGFKADNESFFANMSLNNLRFFNSLYEIKSAQSLLLLSVQAHSYPYFEAICNISTKAEIRSALVRSVDYNNFQAFSYIINNVCIFNTFKGLDVIAEICALNNNTDLLQILFCLFEKDKILGTSIENPAALFVNGSIKNGSFYMPSALVASSQTGNIRLTEIIKKTAESLPKKKVLPFITAAFNSAINCNFDLFQYYVDNFPLLLDDSSLIALISSLYVHKNYEIAPIIYNYYMKNGFTKSKTVLNYIAIGAAYLNEIQMAKDLIKKISELDNNASFEEQFTASAINGNVKLCNFIRTYPINIENTDFFETVTSIIDNEQIETLKILLSIILVGKRGNVVKNGLLHAIKYHKSKSVDFLVTNFLIENENNDNDSQNGSQSDENEENDENDNNNDNNNDDDNNDDDNDDNNNNNDNNNNDDDNNDNLDENEEISIVGIGINVHIGAIPMIFVRAAFYGYLNVIEAMVSLDSSPSFINAISDNFGSALCAAVSAGNEEIVDYLLSLPGIDPNVFNSSYETPLIISAKIHHFSIFTKILNFKSIPYHPPNSDNDEDVFTTKIKNLKDQLNLAFCNFISHFDFNGSYCKPDDDDDSPNNGEGVKARISALPTLVMSDNCQIQNSYIFAKQRDVFSSELIFYKQIVSKHLRYYLPEYFSNDELIPKKDDQKFMHFFLNCNLIDYGFNCHGCNFLIAAVRSKNYELAKILLQKEATDVNFVDRYGMTSLMYAVLNRSLDLIKLMVEYGSKSKEINKKVDFNKQNYFESTAISYASYTNNFEITEYILNQPSFNAEKSNILFSIAAAILTNKKKMALFLLNKSNIQFNFPLNKKILFYKESMKAMEYGNMSYVFKSVSETLLSIAIDVGDINILNAIFNHKCFDQTKVNRAKILYLSASSFKLHVFKFLLEHFQSSQNGDDKNESLFNINTEYKGKSLLFASIFTNYLKITKFIINHPDFDPIKSNAITVLCKAIIEKSKPKVRLIAEIKGIDINGKCSFITKTKNEKLRNRSGMFTFRNESIENAGGMTPLAVACATSPEIEKMLLDLPGIDVNSRCEDGSTPLFYCNSPNSLELMLQQKDLDINAQNNAGLTCMMQFATERQGKFIIALLRVGADLAIKDKEGKSLFDHLGIDDKDIDLSKLSWRETSRLILKSQNLVYL